VRNRSRLPAERDRSGDCVRSSGHRIYLGHLVIVLLASTLAGLRDRLSSDGFEKASDLVSDLTDRCDEFLTEEVG
jgi:hypothetical protein